MFQHLKWGVFVLLKNCRLLFVGVIESHWVFRIICRSSFLMKRVLMFLYV